MIVKIDMIPNSNKFLLQDSGFCGKINVVSPSDSVKRDSPGGQEGVLAGIKLIDYDSGTSLTRSI